MASGSSGRGSDPGSKAFDFGSDDILCSYEDFGNQDGNNGNHSDHSVTTNSAKEFHKSRMSRSSVYPAANYSPPEESTYHQNVVSTVENTMKKHTDNIMRFLEGLSSRLSQLELYCYNVDKSIGEMRSDLVRDHGESESKLKSLEKHMQEVHRSVQILRDKQELADTQKELAKLQLAQKESSAANNSQKSEEKVAPPSSGPMMNENTSDAPEQRLALALPHQVTQPPRPLEHQQPAMPPPPSSIPLQIMPHVQAYYMPPAQMTNANTPSQIQQSQPQYLTPSRPQIQDNSRIAPPPVQSQVNQSPPVQQVAAYQQQWAQQQQPTVQQTQPPVMQQQIRNPSPQMTYSTYIPGHPSQSSQEMAPNSMPMQGTFMGSSLPGSTGSESIPYGYGSSNRPIQPQPPTPNLKISGYGPQHPGDGYVPSGPRQAPAPGSGYIVYDNEGGRPPHHLPPTNPQLHYQQNAYPPTSMPQRMPSPNMVVPPQPVRSHPYNELIEKLVSMGYRGDHVVGVIQRLEESGQPVDFNSVLDRLNGHGGGGSSQRGWSG